MHSPFRNDTSDHSMKYLKLKQIVAYINSSFFFFKMKPYVPCSERPNIELDSVLKVNRENRLYLICIHTFNI